MRLAAVALVLHLALASAVLAQDGDGVNLALPTENDAIFHGGGAQFYQYITRNFKGVKSNPWQGGQYGFVRNPVDTSGGLVYSRFHEGIDIKPVRRDAAGEPLDEVRAIADGRVVHVSLVSGYSNYGRYVVVEHRWGGASYYSLYAHLASVTVTPGSRVARGAQLGVMGYTGSGLNRERAHLHLELNLLLSPKFESWYATFIKNDPNRHGIFNGVNLTGIDIARFYLEQRKRPGLTVPQFLSGEDTFYKVKLPPARNFDLPRRYPWLSRTSADASPPSWEVSFNNAGVPLKVAPGDTPIDTPTISFVQKRGGSYSNYTRGIVTGSGSRARLSDSGQRLMRLLVWPD